MTLAQYAIAGAAGGLVFSTIVIGVTIVAGRKLYRIRQDHVRQFHTSRDTAHEDLRAPGKRFELSPQAERNGHNG